MPAERFVVLHKLMRDLDGGAVYVIKAAETKYDIVEQMPMSTESTDSCSKVCPDHICEVVLAEGGKGGLDSTESGKMPGEFIWDEDWPARPYSF